MPRRMTSAARARGWWQPGAAEARAHATLAAVVMWAVAAATLFVGSGDRSFTGPLKGADFVHLFTLAHIDRRTAPTHLYNEEALYRLQVSLVPASRPERYPTVYPPHAAILFRPFAGWSYGSAALTWAGILVAGYAACVWAAWRPFRHVLHDRRLVIAAAAAFPPFWYLVLHGQTTIVPLLGFSLGWYALERGRRFWAGAAFGLLLLKPQFALVLAVLVPVCREWSMLAGALLAITAQVAATIALLGTSVLLQYGSIAARFPQMRARLEPRPDQLHSLSAITDRLPGGWSTAVWALLSAVAIVYTLRVWRTEAAPLTLRVGALILASVLVNPHVFSYDAAVLALPLLWLGGWLYAVPEHAALRPWFVVLLYALYATVLAPTATYIPIQASVIVLVGVFALAVRAANRGGMAAIATRTGNARA